ANSAPPNTTGHSPRRRLRRSSPSTARPTARCHAPPRPPPRGAPRARRAGPRRPRRHPRHFQARLRRVLRRRVLRGDLPRHARGTCRVRQLRRKRGQEGAAEEVLIGVGDWQGGEGGEPAESPMDERNGRCLEYNGNSSTRFTGHHVRRVRNVQGRIFRPRTGFLCPLGPRRGTARPSAKAHRRTDHRRFQTLRTVAAPLVRRTAATSFVGSGLVPRSRRQIA
ncbi:hypothetical protein DFJ74DRAFT_443710, partial [Hyaloraphidium curvatum]